MAVSALKCGLLPLTQNAMFFGEIGYHDYEGPALDLDEQQRLVRDLGTGAASGATPRRTFSPGIRFSRWNRLNSGATASLPSLAAEPWARCIAPSIP